MCVPFILYGELISREHGGTVVETPPPGRVITAETAWSRCFLDAVELLVTGKVL